MDESSQSVSYGKEQGDYEAWAEFMNIISSLVNTNLSQQSALIGKISVSLKMLLILFFASTNSLACLNSVTKSS